MTRMSKDVFDFGSRDVYLEFTGEYEAELYGNLPRTDAYRIHQDSGLFVANWDWDEYDPYVRVGAYVTLEIVFRAVLDRRTNRIVDFGIKEVNTDQDSL